MRLARLFQLACCLLPLAAGGQVVVTGAVARPGAYPLPIASSVGRLLQAAGGLTAHAGDLATLRLADSPAVALHVALRTTADGLRAEPDTALTDGDRLLVATAGAEAAVIGVQIDGFVRRPGAYPMPLGARLGDLLQAAGGLLPLANPEARLVRGAQSLAVNLAAAARADQGQDALLREGDRVEVASNASILTPAEARVTISGEVGRPGIYPRHRGMRLGDLLRGAGGLTLGAERDRIWLERLTAEGRLRRIPLAPLRALAGDEAEDLLLENGDVVKVPGLPTIRPGAEPVTIAGEVHYPGTFQLAEDQTVGDLLRLAGGPTPDAWLTRALLTRRGTSGRTRQVAMDLSRQPLELPLEPGDLLSVLPIDQAMYAEPTVQIRGDVRYAGYYERTLGMRLSDLVWVAGGVTRNIAFVSCEVARARDTETAVLRPDLERALDQDPQHDVELRDGDTVYVRTVGEYRHEVREVQVFGEVLSAGAYPLRSDAESVRELVERAGGLGPDADPRGAMLLRRAEELVHPNVVRYVMELYSAMIRRRLLTLYAQESGSVVAARPDIVESSLNKPFAGLSGELAVALAGSKERLMLPRDAALLADRDRLTATLVDAAGRPSPAVTEASVSPAYFRVAIDLPAILAGERDVNLRPDDLLIISRRPQTVLVMGEVVSQRPLLHMAGASVAEYLRLCGGLTVDGDLKRLLRLAPNGTADKITPATVLEAGDVLLVLPERYFSYGDKLGPMDIAEGLGGMLAGMARYLLSLSN